MQLYQCFEHAQFEYQVVILGITFFFNWKRQSSQAVRLTELDHHSTSPLPPGLKTLFSLLQSFECFQFKNGGDLVGVSNYYNSEKMRGQTVRPI